MTDPGRDEIVVTRSGDAYLLRLAGPADEDLVRALLERESADDIRWRFFVSMKKFDHRFLCELLSLDEGRATSLIAIEPGDGSAAALACLHQESDETSAEFAMLVRSDLKGHGLGWRLMERLIAEAQAKCYARVEGFVLWENVAMRQFCRSFGFHFVPVAGDPLLTSAVLSLVERPEGRVRSGGPQRVGLGLLAGRRAMTQCSE